MSRVRATLTRDGRTERLSFEDGYTSDQHGPMVGVWGKAGPIQLYRADRFGERLGRAWVRAFAADAGCGVTFT